MDSLLLKGPETAELLGISKALAYQWMAGGVLPTVRVPGCRSVRVPHAALMKWIEERTELPVGGQVGRASLSSPAASAANKLTARALIPIPPTGKLWPETLPLRDCQRNMLATISRVEAQRMVANGDGEAVGNRTVKYVLLLNASALPSDKPALGETCIDGDGMRCHVNLQKALNAPRLHLPVRITEQRNVSWRSGSASVLPPPVDYDRKTRTKGYKSS